MKDVDSIPREELGVEVDRTHDVYAEASSAAEMLAEMHTNLDHIADSNDLPEEHIAVARQLQVTVDNLSDHFEALADDMEDRQDELAERINTAFNQR